jgi:hypothetical protein
LAASLVFAFIISFDEVAASLFVSSPSATTLPVRIFTYIDQNYDPLVNGRELLAGVRGPDCNRHSRARVRRRTTVRAALMD